MDYISSLPSSILHSRWADQCREAGSVCPTTLSISSSRTLKEETRLVEPKRTVGLEQLRGAVERRGVYPWRSCLNSDFDYVEWLVQVSRPSLDPLSPAAGGIINRAGAHRARSHPSSN
jgi:hypothetical protein